MEDFKDCHDVSKPIEAPPKLEEEPQYITLQDLINLAIEMMLILKILLLLLKETKANMLVCLLLLP